MTQTSGAGLRGPSFIDVFCGAGGFSQGACDAGWEHVLGIDMNRTACNSYAANHSHVHCGDVRKLTAAKLRELAGRDRVDVVLGSPPCPSFSTAGSRHSEAVVADHLYKQLVRLAVAMDARAVVLENVPNMATKLGGRYVDGLRRALDAAGYGWVHASVLWADEHGVPQRRRRLLVAAFKVDEHGASRFAWPEPDTSFDASFARIMQTPAQVRAASKRYGYDFHMSAKKIEYYIGRKQVHPAYVRWIDPSKPAPTVRASYFKSRGAEALIVRDTRGKVLTTVTDVAQVGIMRMMTVDEVRAVQTFPPDYRLLGPTGSLYLQVGNAVPCELARRVCTAVGAAL